MRLIDADRLLKPSFTDMFDEPVEMNMFSRYAIESQPTVEAIPIEYIKAFKKEVRDVTNGKAVIDWLLEDWERENEQNNENTSQAD